jgi:hypothetical protein
MRKKSKVVSQIRLMRIGGDPSVRMLPYTELNIPGIDT